MKYISVLFTVLLSITGCRSDMLEKGTKAPDFTLNDQNGNEISLSDFRDSNFVVLVFYPGDNTPVCTKQLCEFRDSYTDLAGLGTVVLGINDGSKGSHKDFASKNSFQYPLLVDSDKEVSGLYNAKGVLTIKRTVYVVDKKGSIIFAKRGKPPVEEVIEAIEGKEDKPEKEAEK